MPTFAYKAINESGKNVSGEIEADSAERATDLLSAKGFIPTSVTDKGEPSASSSLWSKINARLTPIKVTDLILFTKQFRTMLRSGVSIMRLLEILEEQTENLKLKSITGSMARDIKEGLGFNEVFRKHPEAFSSLYCSMIQAGESAGALPEVLDRLTYIIVHEHKIKSDIKSALQYPIIVVIFLAIAFFVLLTFVIPKFVKILHNSRAALPL